MEPKASKQHSSLNLHGANMHSALQTFTRDSEVGTKKSCTCQDSHAGALPEESPKVSRYL